jgi:hypothetical protein
LYREGSLVSVSKELSRYMFDSVGVHVKPEGGGTKSPGEYIVFYEKGNENHELGIVFLVHQRIFQQLSLLVRGCYTDCLHGIAVRVPDYRSGGPGFDSQCHQIF